MDINKNTTYYTYTDAFNKLYGIPNKIKDSKGNLVSQTTDTFGRLRTISVENTNVLEYIYSNYRLSQIKRTNTPAGTSFNYTLGYDAYGNMTSIKAGSTITFTAMFSGGWHALSSLYTGDEYWVFNQYNDSSNYKPYLSFADIYKNGWFIYGIRIDP